MFVVVVMVIMVGCSGGLYSGCSGNCEGSCMVISVMAIVDGEAADPVMLLFIAQGIVVKEIVGGEIIEIR